jgi:Glycosyl transferase 4-like domain
MKALILAYDFPPLPSVGGARPYSWYRYLREFGVEPVVITRQWETRHGGELDYIAPSSTREVVEEEASYGTIIRTPYTPNLSNRLLLKYGSSRLRLLRKAITAHYELAQFYANVGPKRRLYFAGREYLRSRGADVIVATGEPFVLFRYASNLAGQFRVPWIADYRDPWTNDKSRVGHRISKSWDALLERRFTRSASAITTASPFFAKQLLGAREGRLVRIIPNGFNPEAVAGAAGIEQCRDRLTIAFSGSIYEWHPIESVLRVCAEFVRERAPAFQIKFIGVNGPWQVESLLKARYPNLSGHVSFLPRIPYADMARELAHANLLLAFNNYSYTGTKIYDYLALKRRILLCYTNDPEARLLKERHYNLQDRGSDNSHVLEDVIGETSSGVAIRDSHHLAEVLQQAYSELTTTGSVRCDSHGVEKYSRRFGAGLMAEALKDCVGKHSPDTG